MSGRIFGNSSLSIAQARWLSLASVGFLPVGWAVGQFAYYPAGDGVTMLTLLKLLPLVLATATLICAPYLSVAAKVDGHRPDDEMTLRVVHAAAYRSLAGVAIVLMLCPLVLNYFDATASFINRSDIDLGRLLSHLGLFMLVLPICLYSWTLKPLGDDEI